MRQKSFKYWLLPLIVLVTQPGMGQTDDPQTIEDVRNNIIAAMGGGNLSISGITTTTSTYVAWTKISGRAKDIAIGANGSAWALGPNSEIYRWQNNVWVQVQGGAERIAVDPNGSAWVVNLGGQIYKYNLSAAANQVPWTLMPGLAQDIGVGSKGEVWIIGMQNEIAKWNGSSWVQITGGAKRVAVDDTGNPWVVNHGGQIWRYDGTNWALLSGLAQDIGIGGSKVWIVGADGLAYIWNNGTWLGMGGGYLRNISVDKSGMPWGTTASNTIYQSVIETSNIVPDLYLDGDGKNRFIPDDSKPVSNATTFEKTITIKFDICGEYYCLALMYNNNANAVTVYVGGVQGATKTVSIPAGSSGLTILGWNVTSSLQAAGVYFPAYISKESGTTTTASAGSLTSYSLPSYVSFDLLSTSCIKIICTWVENSQQNAINICN